jgi:hypothetical protein
LTLVLRAMTAEQWARDAELKYCQRREVPVTAGTPSFPVPMPPLIWMDYTQNSLLLDSDLSLGLIVHSGGDPMGRTPNSAVCWTAL